jgi:hypothetical protein
LCEATTKEWHPPLYLNGEGRGHVVEGDVVVEECGGFLGVMVVGPDP